MQNSANAMTCALKSNSFCLLKTVSEKNFEDAATFSAVGAKSYLMANCDPNWQQVVDELGPKLYSYFCGSFSADNASDLVQETLIRVVNKYQIGEFDSSKGNLFAFAFGIARFVRLETLKGTKKFEMLSGEGDVEIASASRIADESDPAAHLRWAIRQLNLIEQEILLRMIDEDYRLEQIAGELGIPLGTVKSHVHRAKEKIRKLMEINE